MNSSEYKHGLILGGSTAIAILIIMLAYHLTKSPIEKTNQLQLQTNLVKLLVPGSYDNNPATDTIQLADIALGTNEPQLVYRARSANKPTGAVVTAIAPDGYNGDIALLVGFSYEGDVIAVRVTSHKETPGLGDDIEERRSDWIHSLSNLTPSTMTQQDWDVKKYDGQFDQFTGATITPRAVIHSVNKVAQWYQSNLNIIYKDEFSNAEPAE